MAGARPVRIARMGWILGSMLAAIGGILLGQAAGTIDPTNLTLVVINSFAAAVVGRMRSLPWTFVGAILLGLFDDYVIGYAPSRMAWLANADLAIPMIFLFVVLLLLPQDRLRAIGRPIASAAPRVVDFGRVAGRRWPDHRSHGRCRGAPRRRHFAHDRKRGSRVRDRRPLTGPADRLRGSGVSRTADLRRDRVLRDGPRGARRIVARRPSRDPRRPRPPGP